MPKLIEPLENLVRSNVSILLDVQSPPPELLVGFLKNDGYLIYPSEQEIGLNIYKYTESDTIQCNHLLSLRAYKSGVICLELCVQNSMIGYEIHQKKKTVPSDLDPAIFVKIPTGKYVNRVEELRKAFDEHQKDHLTLEKKYKL